LALLRLKKYIILGISFFFIIFFIQSEIHAETAIGNKYNKIISDVASKYNIPGKLIHSIIKAESNYDARALSSKGAVGLMQLMPDTARKYGVKNSFDPRENIEGGVKYIKDLVKIYDGRTDVVLAAYNAGQEAIKKYGGIPPYPETKKYIERINSSYGKSYIKTKTIIYKYYDESGKLVLTNNRILYLQNKRKK